jgi:hypothetical protein
MAIRAWLTTLLAVVVVTPLLCMRYNGYMLLPLICFLLVYLVASPWSDFRHPEKRVLRAGQAIIWLCSVSLIVGVQAYRASQTHQQAELLLAQIIAYRQSHGSYPATAQAIGYSDARIHDLLGMGGYFLTEGKPTLFYASTYMPYEYVTYNFSLQQWQHRAT